MGTGKPCPGLPWAPPEEVPFPMRPPQTPSTQPPKLLGGHHISRVCLEGQRPASWECLLHCGQELSPDSCSCDQVLVCVRIRSGAWGF